MDYNTIVNQIMMSYSRYNYDSAYEQEKELQNMISKLPDNIEYKKALEKLVIFIWFEAGYEEYEGRKRKPLKTLLCGNEISDYFDDDFCKSIGVKRDDMLHLAREVSCVIEKMRDDNSR